jgi:dihydropyrimidinase
MDDWQSGSQAAAAGGITTVGNMTMPAAGEKLASAVARVAGSARSLVDFVLHPVIHAPGHDIEMQMAAVSAAGIPAVKVFGNLGDFDSHVEGYLAAFDAAAASDTVVMAHAEDGTINAFAARRLTQAGRTAAEFYPETRPLASELAATARLLAFADVTGARLYLVHVSSGEVLDLVAAARRRRVRTFVEGRPLYLLFTGDRQRGPDGPLFVANPPIRGAGDQEALWAGLASGTVDCLGSDHAPWNRRDKVAPGMTATTVPGGLADLETMLPLIFCSGVLGGRISLDRFVEATATTPARLFGLYPQKGVIEPGADADLVVWDPDLERVISAENGFSRSDFSLYEGWRSRGWPIATILRGQVVYQDGQVVGVPGTGRLLRRRVAEADPTGRGLDG